MTEPVAVLKGALGRQDDPRPVGLVDVRGLLVLWTRRAKAVTDLTERVRACREVGAMRALLDPRSGVADRQEGQRVVSGLRAGLRHSHELTGRPSCPRCAGDELILVRRRGAALALSCALCAAPIEDRPMTGPLDSFERLPCEDV